MKKLRKNKVTISVKTGTRDEFFVRGKKTAKMLDEGQRLTPSRIISFEDPDDLIKFLAKTKLVLLAVLRKKPDSITGLARKLHRSRAAVDRDVQLLESVGIIESEYVTNPGHGRCRIIKTTDLNPIQLRVEAII
ncbi:MAG TPA: HTH domain-containing protein [Gammaproteobacteria bacterium]|nr:HTH domain-containing protein [Gammaproteobacteria bacterium]